MQRKNIQKKGSDVYKIETFNSMQDELEFEREALMKERAHLEQKERYASQSQIPSQNTIIQRNGLSEHEINDYIIPSSPKKYGSAEKAKAIGSKIKEVIELCSGEQNSPTQQFQEIIEAEQKILSYLSSTSKVHKSHKKKKKSSHSQSNLHAGQKQKSSIRDQLVDKGFTNAIGDEAMQLIEAIERKALIEIDSLRTDKINLMKKLNAETKAHNKQKKLRIQLERQVQFLIEKLERYGVRAGSLETGIVEEEEESEGEQYGQYEIRKPVHRKSQSNLQEYQRPASNYSPKYFQPQIQFQPQFQFQPQSQPHSHTLNSQRSGSANQIENTITKLEQQNHKMKEALAYQDSSFYKSQLRAELASLQARIRNYEAILNNSNNNNSNNNDQQLQTLLLQGNSLDQDAHRLLRAKNKSQRSTGNDESQKLQFLRELENLKATYENLKMQNEALQKQARVTFDPIMKSYQPLAESPFASQKSHKKSVANYESIINEMNRKISGY